jgi:hypothetical protein
MSQSRIRWSFPLGLFPSVPSCSRRGRGFRERSRVPRFCTHFSTLPLTLLPRPSSRVPSSPLLSRPWSSHSRSSMRGDPCRSGRGLVLGYFTHVWTDGGSIGVFESRLRLSTNHLPWPSLLCCLDVEDVYVVFFCVGSSFFGSYIADIKRCGGHLFYHAFY